MGKASVDKTMLELLTRGGARAELAAAGILVSIVIAMVLPMPVWLLDGLIAINICVSALLIIQVTQIKDSVSLSTFPTLLLITTLFRLSLEVASTRLILLEGHAGHIIQAFGEVVVGGNMVVGLVVFLILTVVQFLVITKGAERVAEVGARFTLDAMPGKQMAIDMEMRGGSIDAVEARRRRALLARENQFFGAMDGAMKFVKGDAIAGIVILLANLVGGLCVGVLQRHLPMQEAMQVYSILTIGDGLVAQLPALLTSLTAGLLVTRVSNGEGEDHELNVGKELAAQLTSHPKAWVTASVAMVVFGLIPGMPTPVFAALGSGAMAFGVMTIRRQIAKEHEAAQAQEGELQDVREFSVIRPFVLQVGSHLSDAEQIHRLVHVVRTVRNRIVATYGLPMPPIAIDFGITLEDADFTLCLDEVRLFGMKLHTSLRAFECGPRQLPALQIEPDLVDDEGCFGGRRRLWVRADKAAALESALGPSRDYWQYLAVRFEVALLKTGPRYFGIQEGQKLVQQIAMLYPEIGKEMERAMPVGRLTDVLQRLLYEQVSIRNVRMIAETLIEWGQRERDSMLLTECVRASLSREICHMVAQGGVLQAVSLEPEVEAAIRDSIRQTAYGNFLALPGEVSEQIIDALAMQLADLPDGVRSACVLSSSDVRPYVRKLFAERFPVLRVLGMTEVPADQQIQLMGVVRLGAPMST
jgi:type III secretion protein V